MDEPGFIIRMPPGYFEQGEQVALFFPRDASPVEVVLDRLENDAIPQETGIDVKRTLHASILLYDDRYVAVSNDTFGECHRSGRWVKIRHWVRKTLQVPLSTRANQQSELLSRRRF